jgi:hypothetical protein
MILHYLADFFAGAFLCNCIPHLVSGLRGDAFPSPFAKPRGVGNSSALANFFWGSFNLIVALVLLVAAPFGLGLNLATALFAGGFFAIGIGTSLHFGRVRQTK